MQENQYNGKAIAAFVLGISSLLFLFIFQSLAPVVAIVGIVFGVISRKETEKDPESGRAFATAGFVCSIVALALSVVVIVCAVCLGIAVLGGIGGLAGLGGLAEVIDGQYL